MKEEKLVQVDLKLIDATQKAILATQKEILVSQKAIEKRLFGNGLVATVLLNEQSVKRLWWWVGGISFFLISGAIGIGFTVITK